MALLQERFDDNGISRNDPANFPARSCDLTPCDFFLRGYLKWKVYANNPTTIEELKISIRHVMEEAPGGMCKNEMINWTDRMLYCEQSHEAHLHDIILKS